MERGYECVDRSKYVERNKEGGMWRGLRRGVSVWSGVRRYASEE